jgi:NAD-dependent dihydropyrimidine dehydrogenase PreA subunit
MQARTSLPSSVSDVLNNGLRTPSNFEFKIPDYNSKPGIKQRTLDHDEVLEMLTYQEKSIGSMLGDLRIRELYNKGGTRYVVQLSHVNELLVNFLRLCMRLIPIPVIDTVCISATSLTIPSEHLAHRLGLIPLNLAQLKKSEKLTISFDTDDTKQNNNEFHSGLLQIRDTDGKITPGAMLHDNICIVPLGHSDHIKGTASVTMMNENDHSKAQAVYVFFRETFAFPQPPGAMIDIEEAGRLQATCKQGVYELNCGALPVKQKVPVSISSFLDSSISTSPKRGVFIINPYKCIGCNICSIPIEIVPQQFVFELESRCNVTGKTLFHQGLQILVDKLQAKMVNLST